MVVLACSFLTPYPFSLNFLHLCVTPAIAISRQWSNAAASPLKVLRSWGRDSPRCPHGICMPAAPCTHHQVSPMPLRTSWCIPALAWAPGLSAGVAGLCFIDHQIQRPSSAWRDTWGKDLNVQASSPRNQCEHQFTKWLINGHLLDCFLITLFSSAGSWLLHLLSLVVMSGGHSPVAVCGPLTGMASLVAEYGLYTAQASVVVAHSLSSFEACGIFPDQGLNLCPLH